MCIRFAIPLKCTRCGHGWFKTDDHQFCPYKAEQNEDGEWECDWLADKDPRSGGVAVLVKMPSEMLSYYGGEVVCLSCGKKTMVGSGMPWNPSRDQLREMTISTSKLLEYLQDRLR